MLQVHSLFKAYAGRAALNGVSFHIERPEVVGLLGPAGAGKTTLLKLLAGVLLPDAGSIEIAGIDALADLQAAQALTGYLPAGAPLYPDLSAQEHLRLMADLRGTPVDPRRCRLSQTVYATGL